MHTVSVVIPTYNTGAFLRQTLDSVVAQRDVNIDVVVVDDGSTDGTPDIVVGYGAPVRLFTQKNAGVCAARNHGIRMAKGDYIAFTDHDDYWYPNKLRSQLDCFNEHPEAGLVFGEHRRWEERADSSFPDPAEFADESRPQGLDDALSGWIYHMLLLDCWILTSTAVIRREALDRCGTFDESLPYGEDYDLWFRLSRHYPFFKLKQVVTLYRQHRTQGSRQPREINYQAALMERAVATWGRCSPDGTPVDERAYRQYLARAHFYHGYFHLHHGQMPTARRSLWRAWRTSPESLRYLAYVLCSVIGYRP